MARKIRSVPVLHGKEADRFIKKADEALKLKGTIDFSKQARICQKIISKSKLW